MSVEHQPRPLLYQNLSPQADGLTLKDFNQGIRDYQNEILSYPLLSQEKEIELSKIVSSGARIVSGRNKDEWRIEFNPEAEPEARDAFEQLVTSNLKLVPFMLQKYISYKQWKKPLQLDHLIKEGMIDPEMGLKGSTEDNINYRTYRGIEIMDLINEGNIGLMKAAVLFKPEKGYRFSTYASKAILNRLNETLSGKDRIISISKKADKIIQGLLTRVEYLYQLPEIKAPVTMELLMANLKKDPILGLKLTEKIVKQYFQMALKPVSLDRSTNGSDQTLKEIIESRKMAREGNELFDNLEDSFGLDEILEAAKEIKLMAGEVLTDCEKNTLYLLVNDWLKQLR